MLWQVSIADEPHAKKRRELKARRCIAVVGRPVALPGQAAEVVSSDED